MSILISLAVIVFILIAVLLLPVLAVGMLLRVLPAPDRRAEWEGPRPNGGGPFDLPAPFPAGRQSWT